MFFLDGKLAAYSFFRFTVNAEGAAVQLAELRLLCTARIHADLTVLAGVPTRLGRASDHLCQPMTLCFRVGNVDKKRFFEASPMWKGEKYEQWKAMGRITNPRENVLVFDYPAKGVLHFNTTRIVKPDPTNPFDLTRAEMEARKQIAELMTFFKECEIPGMENAELLYTASSIGVRESRMLAGEYTLTGKDLTSCTKFEDAIAAGNYDIDIHNPEGSGTGHYYFPDGAWYTIPYRSLIPKAADCTNLIVAGRCISADHEAQASIRIMPICTTLGEAAGVAASVSLDEGVPVQDSPAVRIRKILSDSGAFPGCYFLLTEQDPGRSKKPEMTVPEKSKEERRRRHGLRNRTLYE